MSDSLITKKAIASGFKELTKKKSFEKIKISDITEICGLNRQTFYYHFQDKYELVDWIYYNETINIIITELTYQNWDSKLLQMLIKMKSEAYFYENTLKESYENGFRDYLFGFTVELICHIIDQISPYNVEEEEKKFIAEFYAFGFVGVVISWAQHGMKDSPEYIAMQLKKVLDLTKKYGASHYA